MPRLLELRRLAVLNIFESSLRYCLRLKVELPYGKGVQQLSSEAGIQLNERTSEIASSTRSTA